MKDRFFAYVMLLFTVLHLYYGGYLFLFPKRIKNKFSSERDMTVRMLGLYIALLGIFLFTLVMVYYRMGSLLNLSVKF
jgi:hypothetical protein